MKKICSAIAVLTLLALPVCQAQAAIYMGDETIFVEQPLNGDTYAAGAKVVIDSSVDGDLIVGGGDVTIGGNISEDLMAAGGEIRVRGAIGDDARIFGGDIQVASDVDGDLITFGGRIEVGRDAVVGGDVVINGGEVTLNGDVAGDVMVNGGVLYLNSTIFGNLKTYGGEIHISGDVRGDSTIVVDKITLSDSTSFGGNVTYWSKSGEIDFDSVTTGTVTFDESLKPYKDKDMRKAKAGLAAGMGALAAGAIFYSLLSTLLIIGILVWGTKTYFRDSAKKVLKEPWMNALYGLLYIVATPIIAIMIMISIIGIPVGATVLALYAISITFAKPFTAVVLAKVWEEKQKSKKVYPQWKTALHAFVAYIGLKIIGFVPVLGWLVCFGVVCSAFGGMMRAEYERYLKVR